MEASFGSGTSLEVAAEEFLEKESAFMDQETLPSAQRDMADFAKTIRLTRILYALQLADLRFRFGLHPTREGLSR